MNKEKAVWEDVWAYKNVFGQLRIDTRHQNDWHWLVERIRKHERLIKVRIEEE